MKAKTSEKIQELLSIVYENSKKDGIQDTAIPSFKIIQTSTANEKIHSVYKPSLCVIVQGSKDVILSDEIYTYTPGEYIVASVDLPVTGQVTKASKAKPYLCLMLEIEPAMVFDILKNSSTMNAKAIPATRALFVGHAEDSLFDAFIRLTQCLKNPADIPILTPMIIREIIYRILSSENGDVIKQMGIAGSQTNSISKVIDLLKTNYANAVNVEELAKEANMSTSTFHKYFKEITSMSPIQYQKQIRLQEARRLLMAQAGDAATISYQVGYESPSQFSREYARMFGHPPKTDMKLLKIVN